MDLRSLTVSLFGRNKRTRVDVLFHLGLTLSLSVVNQEVKNLCAGMMVSPSSITESFFRSDCDAGHHVAQVRVVFEIPSRVIQGLFTSPNTTLPSHLAYVEWFSPIPVTPGSNHGLYRVNRLTHNGRRRASIIPVESILRSVHLFPVFRPYTPWEWNTFSVL